MRGAGQHGRGRAKITERQPKLKQKLKYKPYRYPLRGRGTWGMCPCIGTTVGADNQQISCRVGCTAPLLEAALAPYDWEGAVHLITEYRG